MPSTPSPAPIASARRTGATRRLVVLAVTALILATGLVTGARPAAAETPSAPKLLAPVGWDERVLLVWSQVSVPAEPITGYRVEKYKGDAPVPVEIIVVGTKTMALVDPFIDDGTTYRYRVQAINADGNSAWSPKRSIKTVDGVKQISPFASNNAFLFRQYMDLLGRYPSGVEVGAATAQLVDHVSPATIINDLAHDPARVAERHPVLRLYFAFFERSPDVGGTDYWIGKRKAGMNLNTIATKFAASPEFVNTYGALSNQAFVQQVYVNVFDRNPDPAGLAYWATKLDQKQATRGQVMVGFSESPEYKGSYGEVGRSTGRVEAADIHMALLNTAPGNEVLADYAGHIQYGGSQGTVALLMINSALYPL